MFIVLVLLMFLICFTLDETSIGMVKSRISAVGRRLIQLDGADDKHDSYWKKPGYTWGMSTRTQPRDVSYSFFRPSLY